MSDGGRRECDIKYNRGAIFISGIQEGREVDRPTWKNDNRFGDKLINFTSDDVYILCDLRRKPS
jgi:hypothetical protein